MHTLLVWAPENLLIINFLNIMPVYLISPLVNAVGCWLCVSLMLYLVFQPEKPASFLGMKIQGMVPANFKKLSQKLSDIIYQLLISHKEDLKAEITAPEKMDKLMPHIESHIDFFLREKLPKSMPMIAMLIGDKTIGQIKEVFVAEIKVLFPQLIGQYMDGLMDDDRVYPLLTEKLQSAAVLSYVTGVKSKLTRLFFKIKLGAFVFGLVYGLLIGLICF